MPRMIQMLTAVIAAVVMTAGVAGAAPKMDKANGTGHITVGDFDFDIHVNAKSGPLGEDAKGHFFFRRADTEAVPGLAVSGRVTCLTVIGNAATVGGIIESSNDAFFPEGSGFVIGIVDNGSPGKDNDEVTTAFRSDPPVCPPPPPGFGLVLDSGNYVVNDAP